MLPYAQESVSDLPLGSAIEINKLLKHSLWNLFDTYECANHTHDNSGIGVSVASQSDDLTQHMLKEAFIVIMFTIGRPQQKVKA